MTNKHDAEWWVATSGHGVKPGWVPSSHLEEHPLDLGQCVEYLQIFRNWDVVNGELSEEEMVAYCQVRTKE